MLDSLKEFWSDLFSYDSMYRELSLHKWMWDNNLPKLNISGLYEILNADV